MTTDQPQPDTRFCDWQTKCKEDEPGTFSCQAHLHEGRCFQCPYRSYRDSQRAEYPCEDAELLQPQPGRELDEAIARAMGWVHCQFPLPIHPSYAYWEPPKGMVPQDLLDCNERDEFPPPWSTDFATAIATLEQLCKPVEEGERGWTFAISSPGDCDDREVWIVALSKSKWFGSECVSEHVSLEDSKVSLAHAAALAMHAALEAEVKETGANPCG